MALHPFSAEGPGELSISEGDTIELLERVDADWLKGRLGHNEGIFPASFVDVIVDLSAKKETSKKAAAVTGIISVSPF